MGLWRVVHRCRVAPSIGHSRNWNLQIDESRQNGGITFSRRFLLIILPRSAMIDFSRNRNKPSEESFQRCSKSSPRRRHPLNSIPSITIPSFMTELLLMRHVLELKRPSASMQRFRGFSPRKSGFRLHFHASPLVALVVPRR